MKHTPTKPIHSFHPFHPRFLSALLQMPPAFILRDIPHQRHNYILPEIARYNSLSRVKLASGRSDTADKIIPWINYLDKKNLVER